MNLMAVWVVLAVASGGVSPPCGAPEYRQLDFWLGDWDSFDSGEKEPSARVRVDSALDGCAIRERYEGANGSVGESLSTYDAARKLWHQTWITNRGQFLVIEGRFLDGRMVLEGTLRDRKGGESTIRGTWKGEGATVHEWAETSPDSGKTWTVLFDIVFRHRRVLD